MLLSFRWICLLLIVGSGANAAFSQGPPAGQLSPAVNIPEIGSATRTQLEQVKVFIDNRQWDDAVEILRRVMENDGSRLIAVAAPDTRQAGFRRFITLREYCHWRLAMWAQSAPEALRLYRRQVDSLAQRWYEQAAEERDAKLLQRIVDEMFVSSYGDDALYRLGEHRLEQGDHLGARFCWERISPLMRTPTAYEPLFHAGPGRPLWLGLRGLDWKTSGDRVKPLLTTPQPSRSWLSYPDSDLDLAAVRARLALISILEGSPERAAVEIDCLERIDPQASGRLAGEDGPYAARLQTLLKESQRWPTSANGGDWPTFAGAFTRNHQAEGPVDLGGPPLWRRNLPTLRADGEMLSEARQRVAESRLGLLSYHPVIWNDKVFWSELNDIKAFDLLTGKASWPLQEDAPRDESYGSVYRASREQLGAPARRPYVGVPRYTLSADGGRLFARMGAVPTAEGMNARVLKRQQGYLVGLDLAAEGKLLRGFPYFPDDEDWAFDGTPVVRRNHLFVAMRRRDDIGAQAHVACFALENGKLLWRRRICGAETLGKGQLPEITHNLLTLGSDTIYFNSNQGVISALRAADGEILWLMQYPRAPAPDEDPDRPVYHFFRDLTPCLLYGGMLIVAPGDCGQIFAVDAATGQLIWTTAPQRADDAVHLLGVGANHLIASGEYLYWFDVYSGQLRTQFPGPRKLAPSQSAPSPSGFGRGLLAGEVVYWPTRESIYIFQQQPENSDPGWQPVLTRKLDLLPRRAGGGNLLISRGVLLIATESQVIALGSTAAPAGGRK